MYKSITCRIIMINSFIRKELIHSNTFPLHMEFINKNLQWIKDKNRAQNIYNF